MAGALAFTFHYRQPRARSSSDRNFMPSAAAQGYRLSIRRYARGSIFVRANPSTCQPVIAGTMDGIPFNLIPDTACDASIGFTSREPEEGRTSLETRPPIGRVRDGHASPARAGASASSA